MERQKGIWREKKGAKREPSGSETSRELRKKEKLRRRRGLFGCVFVLIAYVFCSVTMRYPVEILGVIDVYDTI